ncbi:MAG: chorismate synthase [Peptococcaceae bacterium]|nr:chorismate synthase [Peptococcaceae bacterium]
MLRYLSAGESHGRALVAIIEGLPAGMPITTDYINRQLARRQGGYGRGKRMAIETDTVTILSGVRGGYTLGSPIALQIENKDWANWEKTMSPEEGVPPGDRVVSKPRPGHADLAGALKYGHKDMRNVLERASARETAIRVAAGSMARRLLEEMGIEVFGFIRRIGAVKVDVGDMAPDILKARAAASEMLCPDPVLAYRMMESIDHAREAGDSLGGEFEIRVTGVPPGLGSYAQWDRKLDARLAGAVMSIQAIKGVEIGLGFEAASRFGSQVQDEIFFDPGRGFYRSTNNAGGIEGGVSNGETIVVRGAMKPIPTLRRALRSVDFVTKEPVEAAVERSDICAVPAACVIGEAVVAWEVACAFLEKFGGDSLQEVQYNYRGYLARLKEV